MEQDEIQTDISRPKRPLLQTKLVMPRSRANLIERPRLLQRLGTAVEASGATPPKLTLISGPAGYGKSTLAVQWVCSQPVPVAWLSLDVGEMMRPASSPICSLP